MTDNYTKLSTAIRHLRFLLYLLAAAAWGQDRPAFRSDVELVAIPCAVVDEKGAPVAGLTREDFRVYDNGVRRIVEHLWVDRDLPLTLGILIDASESQSDELAQHRQTALDLLEQILRPGDRAFVISVGADVRLWADLAAGSTAGMAELRRQLAAPPGAPFGEACAKQQSSAPGLRPISVCGASPLWNAIFDAAHIKMRPIAGNKALLILTDGFDSGSTHTWRQAADEVHAADTTLYAIQYRSKFGGSYAPDLYRLAVEAGGVCFDPPANETGRIAVRIETDLRRRYVLDFHPEKQTGKRRHDVRVEVVRPELSVRARKVYFEPSR